MGRPSLVEVPRELWQLRHRDPYPYFEWLRRNSPARPEFKDNGISIWQVSRYADVRALLVDERLSKRPELVPQYVAGPTGLNRHLVHADPPEHTRLRRLVNAAFIPRRIAALEPLVRQIAESLLDELPGTGLVDLIDDFALPLTFTMICAILGVPEELNTSGIRQTLAATVSPSGDPQERRRQEQELVSCLRELIAIKRHRRSADSRETDLLAALVAANADDDRLSEEELLGTAYLLLLVGHDTTVNLIGNGMLALLSHPDQLTLLAHDRELMPTAVEELLRYDSPVRDATFRATVAPVEVADTVIPAGAIVSLLIGSANRDERQFNDPDRLDICRAPNDHLAFGRGPHFCIGAALARMEGGIAINLLLDRFPQMRLATPAEQLPWRPARVMRGLLHLPILVG